MIPHGELKWEIPIKSTGESTKTPPCQIKLGWERMKLTVGENRGKARIKVTVEVMSWLKEDFGHHGWDKLVLEETISPGTSIMSLLHLMGGKYPKFGRKAFTDPKQDFLDYCLIILNGSLLSAPAELNTELKEGNNIKLSPGFYGG